MKGPANKTLETNCRPASPLEALWQFEPAVHAQACVPGGKRKVRISPGLSCLRAVYQREKSKFGNQKVKADQAAGAERGMVFVQCMANPIAGCCDPPGSSPRFSTSGQGLAALRDAPTMLQ